MDDPRLEAATRHSADASTGVRDDVGEELVGYLERDQLEAEMDTPLPLASLSRLSRIGLWALRVFVVVVGAMVIYTFVAGLH